MIQTHLGISQELCGIPIKVANGEAIVELKATQEMTADEQGLVHGGFLFGLADYAAMLAVNHPNVVLGRADVKFLKPSRVGSKSIAKAKVIAEEGNKKVVDVLVSSDNIKTLKGTFTCFVLGQHVLSDPEKD
ncbi:MAG: PaaI family thioesterase [Myxococcota bacterium]|nr:PaaI family thioesterase [Myxococcota bacterium]